MTATQRPRFKSIIFDVDSTLSGIEGIDWLASLRGEAEARESAELTERAMEGKIPIEEIYTRRLAAIRPTGLELIALAHEYQSAMQPGARELIAELRTARCQVHLLSGGLRTAIVPFAMQLGVRAENVHAVSLTTDADGTFSLLDGEQLLATQVGKPTVVHRLQLPGPVVMVGDGSTDAAVRGVVDTFIAYTGVARREQVIAVADAEASDFTLLRALLFEPSARVTRV